LRPSRGSASEIETAARVVVPTAGGGYPVWIGGGLLDRIDQLLPPLAGAEAAAVVHPPPVAAAAATVGRALARLGLAVHTINVPAGEAAKRLEVVAGLYERLAAVPTHRADPVVAVGGGSTTDVAGFAAATWLRGVPLVNVPTTLLGMVDAAVGGKTGVDLPAGKNLAGAFHQPVAVVADLGTLATLPAEEIRSGLAEVAKAGLVGDPDLAAAVAGAAGRAIAGDPEALGPLVEAAVRVKATMVGADEREAIPAGPEGSREPRRPEGSGEPHDGPAGRRSGPVPPTGAGEPDGGAPVGRAPVGRAPVGRATVGRLALNYGHTLGHALERLAGYRDLRHGEAVAIGMVFAARVAEATGLAAPGLAAGHVELLRAIGLPVTLRHLDPEAVLAAMATDKKHHHGLRLVLLREVGEPAVVQAPDRAVLTDAIGSLGEEPP
jgi:3-dehydroquinate synthase